MDEEKKQEERPVAPKPPPPVSVTIVETAGPTALIQWEQDGAPQRGYVPAKEVKEGTVSRRALDAAAPYGVQWAKYAQKIELSPTDIERALHKRDVWTLDDMALHRASVGVILADLFGLNDLIRRVSKLKRG